MGETAEERAKRLRAVVRHTTDWRARPPRKRRPDLFGDIFGEDQARAGEIAGPEDGPLERLVNAELRQELADCLGRRTPVERFITNLYYHVGLSASEIADLLRLCAELWPCLGLSGETTEQVVWNMLHKVRKKIRRHLQERG